MSGPIRRPNKLTRRREKPSVPFIDGVFPMRFLPAATLGLLAAPLLAQTALPGAPDPSRVASGTYKVEPAHTQVLFTVNHLGFTEYTGQFRQPSGTLVIDRAKPANDKLDVSFDIAKVSTTVPALDEHLQKPEFFNTAQFPTGRFVSSKVTLNGNMATIDGDLTMRGVTKPVVLQARFIGAGVNPLSKKPTIGFRATTSIMRSQWGVSYGLPVVSDKVELTINAAFEPAA